ncbi:MAG TPA: DUF4142 domain-containing protein [Bryobacteraceae bacterium]|jgi:putative membrane protein|nr:DUF4142 domain-containing protein [Bryobacteraceae bacterium]
MVAALALTAGTFVAGAAGKGPGKKTLRALAETDVAQVDAGRIAQKKSANPVIQKFAQQMVQDHTQMLSSTRFMAQQHGVTLPTTPSDRQQADIRRLQTLSGKDFDYAYLQGVIGDSQKSARMLPRHERAADPAVSSYLQKTQAALEDHIRAAQHAAAQLGTSAHAASNPAVRAEKASAGERPQN